MCIISTFLKILLPILINLLIICPGATAKLVQHSTGVYQFTRCNHSELQQIKNLAAVQSLIIDECNITTLPNAYFMRFSNLIELEITDSKLSYMMDYALHGLLRLKTLSLANNNLSTVKSWSNEDLSALISLDLHRNAIRTLTLKSFHRYPNLQRLNLAGNLLDDIDEGIFRWMPHLKYLNLGRNRLKLIDEHTFHGMNRLVQLALHHNQLEHIEREAFDSNTHLRSLRLEGNAVVDLDFLRSKALTRLVHLNLSHNWVDTLQVLNWNREYELTVLDVSYNRLTQVLDDTFAGLEAIEHLNLSHNAVELITSHSFADLINLNSIDLSCNNLTELSAHLLHNLTELQTINLSHNALTTIDGELFSQQPHLQSLDLSHNQLHTDNFIERLAPELNRLALSVHLSDNRYEWLNISTLKEFKRVDLAGNRWHCEWLIRELLRAPPNVHFSRNFTVATWSAAMLDINGIDCYEVQQKRSIIVLDANRLWDQQRRGGGGAGPTHKQALMDVAGQLPTPPPLTWPRVRMDKFDSRSIIIWMLIAIALAFAALRLARQLIDRREQRKRLRKLRAQQMEMMKDCDEEQQLEVAVPPYEAAVTPKVEDKQKKAIKS